MYNKNKLVAVLYNEDFLMVFYVLIITIYGLRTKFAIKNVKNVATYICNTCTNVCNICKVKFYNWIRADYRNGHVPH